jgi:hypothetical protein
MSSSTTNSMNTGSLGAATFLAFISTHAVDRLRRLIADDRSTAEAVAPTEVGTALLIHARQSIGSPECRAAGERRSTDTKTTPRPDGCGIDHEVGTKQSLCLPPASRDVAVEAAGHTSTTRSAYGGEGTTWEFGCDDR